MFLWRNTAKQNYLLIITKYPPYLFHWNFLEYEFYKFQDPNQFVMVRIWMLKLSGDFWLLFLDNIDYSCIMVSGILIEAVGDCYPAVKSSEY